MKKMWMVVIGLALALPMVAYVAGSLAAADDEPGDRTPIRIVEQFTSPSPTSEPTKKPEKKKQTPKPKPKPNPGTDDDDDDGPDTITVRPDNFGDDDDDGGRDDDGDDDGGGDDGDD